MRKHWAGFVFATAFGVALVGAAIVLRYVDRTSTWAESLAASGTVGASMAALYIATRDRFDRRTERLEADRAQAGLISVAAHGPGYGPGETGLKEHFIVHVQSVALQPVVDIELVSARYVEDDRELPLELLVQVRSAPKHAILMPSTIERREWVTFQVHTTAETGQLFAYTEVTPGATRNYYNCDPARVFAVIEFSDANGNRWRRDTSGLVELIKKTGGAPRAIPPLPPVPEQ
ncbi:hypothetical protein FHT40_004140 [Mycolicibacterium sp. BK556]|uniref:hypothetical protein n=1 Tax=unclassified Mycolicibacterium TaxID=2636767 RepID=UPI0016085C65|nr:MULTISPECIES: hypothetical protein [unclassified Mycolicibacterium]MBB3604462.1 hypothetical protein [Mycolicibacterium sp. BK556]MBB3634825.1 hypothetical protein [Mycolicibacterium sp. BK607]